MENRLNGPLPKIMLFTLLILLAIQTGCQRGDSAPNGVINQEKTPHFLDSFPVHKEVFTETPKLVKINFNFDLNNKSSIKISKDGRNVTDGNTMVAEDNLSMRAGVKSSGDGTYLVTYRAIWPDGSGHNGKFSFSVDKNELSKYVDMTGEAAVRIDLKDLAFSPRRVIVSQGTKVTWVNMEAVDHFVNSDPHASHNVLPNLNSRGLKKDGTYSYVFNEVGEWGYHCSAHFPDMTGRVIVRESAAGLQPPATADEPAPAAVEHLRTPHFVQSDPAHGATLTAVPAEVTISFNFTLDHDSSIRVLKGGTEVQTGAAVFGGDDLVMRVPISADRGTGTYIVKYTAYWPDKTFHEGQFAFAVQ